MAVAAVQNNRRALRTEAKETGIDMTGLHVASGRMGQQAAEAQAGA